MYLFWGWARERGGEGSWGSSPPLRDPGPGAPGRPSPPPSTRPGRGGGGEGGGSPLPNASAAPPLSFVVVRFCFCWFSIPRQKYKKNIAVFLFVITAGLFHNCRICYNSCFITAVFLYNWRAFFITDGFLYNWQICFLLADLFITGDLFEHWRRPGRMRQDRMRPGRMRPDHLRPDRLRPDRLRPDRLRSDPMWSRGWSAGGSCATLYMAGAGSRIVAGPGRTRHAKVAANSASISTSRWHSEVAGPSWKLWNQGPCHLRHRYGHVRF